MPKSGSRFYFFPVFLFAITIFLSILRISGSSVAMFNEYLYGKTFRDNNLIFGKPRPIRSDEWLLSTPLTIAEFNNKFNHIMNINGLNQEFSLLMDLPTNHWSTIFSPTNWSFFVMPLENAFAFKWWFRIFLLVTGTYFTLFKLTKDLFLSISGSLILYFTPFFQWWIAVQPVDSVSYPLFIFYIFVKLLHFKNKKQLLLYSILIAYFIVCFVLILYPPFQISMALFITFLAIGYLLNNYKQLNHGNFKYYAISGSLVVFSVAAILFFYYHSIENVINIIYNTDYPGKRRLSGGGFPLTNFFFGFYNIFLQFNPNLPKILNNQSEASSFFMLFPFLLPLVFFDFFRKLFTKTKIDFIPISISLYLVLGLIWIFIGLPDSLSRIFLLNFVTNNRMILGLGTGGLFLMLYFLKYLPLSNSKFYKICAITLASAAFFMVYYVGSELINYNFWVSINTHFPFYLFGNILKILSISIIAYFLVAMLLFGRQKLFLASILFFSVISSFVVNPLYKGLGLILSTPILEDFKHIESSNSRQLLWLVYDNLTLQNYLSANSLRVFNSVQIYPVLDRWKILDPEEKYRSIYNRYALIIFRHESKNISFRLIYPNNFEVNIDPCDEKLKESGIGYFVFNSKVNYPCIKFIQRSSDFYIYQRID